MSAEAGPRTWARRGQSFLESDAGWLSAWALLLLATVVAYRSMRHLDFTDMDALADYAAARVDSVGDLVGQVTKPLTGGTAGVNANFYRPVVMLQFALLRALFGAAPLGFQVWDLGLHLSVVVMVGCLARSVGLGRPAAWAAGAIVALHPLGVEIVPAVARDIDLLYTVFVMGALLAVAHRRAGIAAVLGLLALGSKETTVAVLPVVMLFWWWLHGRRGLGTLGRAWGVGLFAYLLARFWVLRGMGGYGHELRVHNFALVLRSAVWETFFPSWSRLLERVLTTPSTQLLSGALVSLLLLGAVFRSWRRGERMVVIGFALWLSPMVLYGITGVYGRRMLYLPVVGMSFAMASWLQDRVMRWPLLGVLGLMLPGSPLFDQGWGWALTDRMTRSVTTSLEDDLRELSPGSTIWLVDRCSRMNVDVYREKAWSNGATLNTCATVYSLQAWADDRLGDGHVRYRLLSEIMPNAAVPGARVRVTAAGVEILRAPVIRVFSADAAGEGWVVSERGDWLVLAPPPSASGDWMLVAGGEKGALVQIL